MEADNKEAWEYIWSALNVFEACMSLIVHEGKVGAVGTTDEAAVGYYFVKWLSEPYTLHDDTEADWLASAANQCGKCATARIREGRGKAEEGRRGIVSRP